MRLPDSPLIKTNINQVTEPDAWNFVHRNFASLWFDGFPLGNGDLGALMMPDQKHTEFRLAKSDVWDERCRDENGERRSFQPFKSWAQLKELIETQQWDAIDERAEQAERNWQGRFGLIPAAILSLDTVHFEKEIEITDFTRRLDMSQGVAINEFSTRVRHQVVEALVSVAQNVLAVRVRCELDAAQGLPYRAMKLGMDLDLKITSNDPEAVISAGGEDDLIWAGLRGYHEVDYSVAVLVQGNDIAVARDGTRLTVTPARQDGDAAAFDFTIYLAIASQGDGAQTPEMASQRVRAAAEDGWDRIRKEHEDWWRFFWSASQIGIPECDLLRQYHFGLYLLGSSSRRGCVMPGLQGLWPWSRPLGQGWNEYTNDLNIEMNYWPVYTSNHLDLAWPYYDTVRGWLPEARRFTRDYYGCEGVQFSCCSAPSGIMSTGYLPTNHWFGHAAFVAQNFWTHFLYSQDSDFLREVAYPMLKECAQFYLTFLKKDDKGRYEFWPSSHPEAGEGSYEAWGRNPAFDIAFTAMLFKAVVESTRLLNCHPDIREACLERLGNMPPYPTRDGALIELEDKEFLCSQRHTGGLSAIYPTSEWAGEEHRKNAAKSLDLYLAKGVELTGCHTAPWVGCVAARVGRGEQARGALREFMTSYTEAQGGFNLNYDYHRTGRMAGPPTFCNESNSGYSANLLEMLLQSHLGLIRVFPAIPGDWRDVSFRGLRAEGAFLVSAVRSGGTIREIEIHAERDGEARLANPWRDAPSITVGGHVVETTFRDGVLAWKANAGATYRIST